MYRSHREWAFLKKKATILSKADLADYALPADFGHVLGEQVYLDGAKVDLVFSNDEARVSARSGPTATITQLTDTPYANDGTVFPVYGLKTVLGQGTQFADDMVGRFFRADRDGFKYRVANVVNPTQMELDQTFAGASQKGKVNVFADNLRMVVGNPFVTRFSEDMVNGLIWVEGTSDYKQISEVDERNQTILIPAADTFDADGTDLQYSIQDRYQIDPPGMYVLSFLVGGPAADDEEITLTYYAAPEDLTDLDFEIPIPSEYHDIIASELKAKACAMFGRPSNLVSYYEGLYREGRDDAVLTHDPLRDVPKSVNLKRIQ